MKVADTHLKRIELLTNVLVVITSIVLVAVLARNLAFRPQSNGPESKKTDSASVTPGRNTNKTKLAAGTELKLPELERTQGKRTLILALSTTCRYCTDSAEFYRKLRAEVDARTQLVAVFPQSVDGARNYLTGLGVTVDQVIQSPLSSISVAATPTLILVSDEGKVIESWRGKLPAALESQVISQVLGK